MRSCLLSSVLSSSGVRNAGSLGSITRSIRKPPASGSRIPVVIEIHQLLAMFTVVTSMFPTILADSLVMPLSSASSEPSRIPLE